MASELTSSSCQHSVLFTPPTYVLTYEGQAVSLLQLTNDLPPSEMYLADVMINDPKKNPLSYKEEGTLHNSAKSERPMGAPKGDAMWKRCFGAHSSSGTTQGKRQVLEKAAFTK